MLIILAVEAFSGFALTSRTALALGPWIVELQRDYYVGVDQNLMSYNAACARYDRELTYLLKPPGCDFDNREYQTKVKVNSAGLRDTEDSLTAPSVVFVGDSVTAGWGVEAAERFSDLIGDKIGEKVLNAGIPSYATGREIHLLKRLDLSRVRAIVLQYSENDSGENSEYAGRKFVLSPMSEEDFGKVTDLLTNRRAYWPGKFISSLYRWLRNRNEFRWAFKSPDLTEAQEFTNFVSILCHHIDIFEGKSLVIFTVTRGGYYQSVFSEEIRARLRENADCQSRADIRVLDIDRRLSDNDFFLVDDHPSAVGHHTIATALVDELEKISHRVPLSQRK